MGHTSKAPPPKKKRKKIKITLSQSDTTDGPRRFHVTDVRTRWRGSGGHITINKKIGIKTKDKLRPLRKKVSLNRWTPSVSSSVDEHPKKNLMLHQTCVEDIHQFS